LPDSPEVRIARLDEALKGLVNRLEAISDAYAPTNKTVIENALKIAELEKDLAELRHDFIKAVEKREELFRNFENKVLSCADGVGSLERRVEKQRIADENRQRRIREALEQKAKDDRRQRNRWIIGLTAAFITAMASVYLGTVLGG